MNCILFLDNENEKSYLLYKDIEKNINFNDLKNIINNLYEDLKLDKLSNLELDIKNYIKDLSFINDFIITNNKEDISLYHIDLKKLDEKESFIVYLEKKDKNCFLRLGFLDNPLIYFLENEEFLEISKLYDNRTLFENTKNAQNLIDFYYEYLNENEIEFLEEELVEFEDFLSLYNDNIFFINNIKELDFMFFHIIDNINKDFKLSNNFLENLVLNIYNTDINFDKKELKYKDKVLNIINKNKLYKHIIYNYNILEAYINIFNHLYLNSLDYEEDLEEELEEEIEELENE